MEKNLIAAKNQNFDISIKLLSTKKLITDLIHKQTLLGAYTCRLKHISICIVSVLYTTIVVLLKKNAINYVKYYRNY